MEEGGGGDTWGLHKDAGRGVDNKAVCVIYGVETQWREVFCGGVAHICRSPFWKHEVCSMCLCISLGSLRFMWRPDVCPLISTYTKWEDLMGFPAKKMILVRNIDTRAPQSFARQKKPQWNNRGISPSRLLTQEILNSNACSTKFVPPIFAFRKWEWA